jgi:two-component system nitrate/nitrite response regulator NarL
MLKTQRDIQIIGASGNNKNTILETSKMKPNVILIDLGLRSQRSLQMVDMVKREFPEAKLIVMDLAPVKADILMFVKAGASGFILKESTFDEFLNTIRTVAEGAKVLPVNTSETLFTQIVDHAIRSGKPKLKEDMRLTKREQEIIQLLSDALSSKEIAQKLLVSPKTVKSQLQKILEKLELYACLDTLEYAPVNSEFQTITSSDVATMQK